MRWAEVSTIRRAPHDGQKPRHLHEKARARPGEVLMAAAVAFYPDKAMLQATATQVVLELVDDEARQIRIALTQVLKECAEVCLNEWIQRRLLGAMPAIEMLIADVPARSTYNGVQ